LPGSPVSAITTSYSYDPTYNKPARVTDPLGRVTEMKYDPASGNLLSASGKAPPTENSWLSFQHRLETKLLGVCGQSCTTKESDFR
jgi:YD repeat-containing protein